MPIKTRLEKFSLVFTEPETYNLEVTKGSIYSSALSPEEVQKLMTEWPAIIGKTPVVHMSLYYFAMNVRSPQKVALSLRQYAQMLESCSCWYCEAVKKKAETEGLTVYDIWLRALLWTGGSPKNQLN